MSKNLYIVPYDFTPAGDVAIQTALFLGKYVHTDIKLLHLTNSKKDSIQAELKLKAVIEKLSLPDGLEMSYIVSEGSIFEDIGKIVAKYNAQLVIMATHGALGLQKLFGSNAMKVVTSAEAPFLIVQKNTQLKEIKNIVVPIDLTKESLQIVNVAGDIADIFKSTVHVLGEKQNDELLSQQMKNRILIVKNQYEERRIPCSVEFMKGGGSYQKKIMQYCKDNTIDMIGIAYHSESLLPQFDTFAQSLITNDIQLPCLVLNSKLASALYF